MRIHSRKSSAPALTDEELKGIQVPDFAVANAVHKLFLDCLPPRPSEISGSEKPGDTTARK